MPVDTSKVPQRRVLRFESLDQAIAEADKLAAADRAGKLTAVGNWTYGQALNHVATWAEYSYTGAPLSAPFFIRWILRMQKKKFLTKPMKPGVKIPKVQNGTLATEPMPTDAAMEKFHNVFRRLRTEAPTVPNTIFGPLTHDEWKNLNLRHAELHLGFFIPQQ
jgi:Protein of unknown function (DUF1569)